MEITLRPDGLYNMRYPATMQIETRLNEDGILNLDMGNRITLYICYRNNEPISNCDPKLPGRLVMSCNKNKSEDEISWVTQVRDYNDANNQIVQFLALAQEKIQNK